MRSNPRLSNQTNHQLTTNSTHTNASTGPIRRPAQTNFPTWHVGLINIETGRYLTSEFFSRRAAASANVLRKQQVWILEPDPENPLATIYIRNHEGLYLVEDEWLNGNLRCAGLTRAQAVRFEIEVQQNEKQEKGFQARYWRFRDLSGRGYLSADKIGLRMAKKVADKSDFWLVHLSAHPQISLKNVSRCKYARAGNKEFRIDENTPWGSDALITLDWHPEQGGRYGLKACNGHYLTRHGYTRDGLEPGNDTLFFVEWHRGYLVFRDIRGWYLTATGPSGILGARATTISRNELWLIEDSLIQFALIGANGKKVTARGVDLVASKDSISDYETFQLEMNNYGRSQFRTVKETYWSVHHVTGALQSISKDKDDKEAQFDVDWHADGGVSIKDSANRYLTAKANGHMFANSSQAGINEKFLFYIVNRPILVLRCDYGYVGFRSEDSPRMECNRPDYDVMTMVPAAHGGVFLRASNNKYLRTDRNADVWADAEHGNQEEFNVAVRGNTKMSLQTASGRYLRANQSGPITADGMDQDGSTLWEFSGRGPGASD